MFGAASLSAASRSALSQRGPGSSTLTATSGTVARRASRPARRGTRNGRARRPSWERFWKGGAVRPTGDLGPPSVTSGESGTRPRRTWAPKAPPLEGRWELHAGSCRDPGAPPPTQPDIPRPSSGRTSRAAGPGSERRGAERTNRGERGRQGGGGAEGRRKEGRPGRTRLVEAGGERVKWTRRIPRSPPAPHAAERRAPGPWA